MTEAEFNERLDDLMIAIEDAIDASGADIDFESSEGILTLTFANGSKIILSRQGALRQLWMAAKGGGFHFNYVSDSDDWVCDSTGEEFAELLNQHSSVQAGEAIQLQVA